MRESARPVKVELLADELRSIAGWGCFSTNAPARLALMPVLRKLVQVDLSLSPVGAGCIIRRHIAEEINVLPDGDYRFRGKTYPAEIMRKAFRIELVVGRNPKYSDYEGDHKGRHYRLMLELGRRESYEVWRKGPERELLAILADHMIRLYDEEAA